MTTMTSGVLSHCNRAVYGSLRTLQHCGGAATRTTPGTTTDLSSRPAKGRGREEIRGRRGDTHYIAASHAQRPTRHLRLFPFLSHLVRPTKHDDRELTPIVWHHRFGMADDGFPLTMARSFIATALPTTKWMVPLTIMAGR